MKFSYFLVKKLLPDLKNKKTLIEALNLFSFETEDSQGDTFEVTIPANRYSDAASHFGLVQEAAAILKLTSKIPKIKFELPKKLKTQDQYFSLEIKEEKLCPRYLGLYFENIKIKESPSWLQKVLKDCGLRPINNVVDIMNYVMLETGQPLHAFDYDKLSGRKIIVRKAKIGEKITTLDGQSYYLNPEILVIADDQKPQALAGIKGGKEGEVTQKTSRIVVEIANFDSVAIYRASKKLNLTSDASSRFAHGLNPLLIDLAAQRVIKLLKDLVGARLISRYDFLTKLPSRKVLKLDIKELNQFIGFELSKKESEDILKRLGFKKIKKEFWEVPPLRQDIQNHQDLFEEIIRIYGYNRLLPKPPQVFLQPAKIDDLLVLKNKTRKIIAKTSCRRRL